MPPKVEKSRTTLSSSEKINAQPVIAPQGISPSNSGRTDGSLPTPIVTANSSDQDLRQELTFTPTGGLSLKESSSSLFGHFVETSPVPDADKQRPGPDGLVTIPIETAAEEQSRNQRSSRGSQNYNPLVAGQDGQDEQCVQRSGAESPTVTDFGTLPDLSFPTNREAFGWLTFILTYGSGIAVPAFISASFYASLTVDTEFSGDDPFIVALWYLVKSAMTVPVILGLNSAQILLSSLVSRAQKDGFSGLLYEIIHPEMLLPLGISFISALSTAYVAECRNEGQFAPRIVEWFMIAAMVSATVTNTRLIRDILIKNFKLSRIEDPQGFKKILNGLLDDLSSKAAKLESVINHKTIEKTIKREGSRHSMDQLLLANSDSSLGKLLDVYLLLRDEKNAENLMIGLVKQWDQHFCDPSKELDLFKEKTLGQLTRSVIKYIAAGGAAGIYTLPNLFSGIKAADFSATLLPFIVPGYPIGGASFGINAMINTFSLFVLFNGVADFYDDPKKAWANTSLLWDTPKALLLLLYVFAQVGMVLAFPAEIPGFDLNVTKLVQLVLTVFVAFGLGLFSLDGAFKRVRNQHDLIQSGSLLETGNKEALITLRALNLSSTVVYCLRHGEMPNSDYINEKGGQGIPLHSIIGLIQSQLAALKSKINAMEPKKVGKFYEQIEESVTANANALEEGTGRVHSGQATTQKAYTQSPIGKPAHAFSSTSPERDNKPRENSIGEASRQDARRIPSDRQDNFLATFRGEEEGRRNRSFCEKLAVLCGYQPYAALSGADY